MGRAHEVRKASMAATAAKKTKIYSYYGKEIYQAAKSGGPDPDANLSLRAIINKAKKDQVPSHVINNALDRVKSGATDNYDSLQFEGFGPNGSTLIVKCLTDNVNRTISQVRPAFTKAHSKLGAEGSVSYLYNVEAVVQFKGLSEEDALDALIEGEVDAKDITTLDDGSIKITGEPTDYNNIKVAIQAKLPKVEFDIDEIQTIPTETVELEGEDMDLFERLMNLLNDCEDVDQVYHNVSNYNDGEEE
jgi:YebC/PmpR family DNA-binding regulatory protein